MMNQNVTIGVAVALVYMCAICAGIYQAYHIFHLAGQELSRHTLRLDAHINEDRNWTKSSILNENWTTQHQCHFKENVFYLKIHKTASSTTTTLLYRLAWKHQLTIVPVTRDPYPQHDILDYVMHFPGEKIVERSYNILAEHVIYNEKDIKKLLQKNAIYIATIRYPMAQFKSAFHEFLAKQTGIKASDPVKTFLENVYVHTANMTPRQFVKTANHMIQEFGILPCKVNHKAEVHKWIKYIQKHFDLIMIAEYYDESLIMLRQLMCWEMKDIIYLSQRTANYKYKSSVQDRIIRQTHRTLSAADYMLYDHFVGKLHQQLSKQTGEFWSELYHFRQVNNVVRSFCSNVENELKKNAQSIYALANKFESIALLAKPYGGDFVVTAIECAVMKLRTRVMRNILKVLQMPELCALTSIRRYHASLLQGITWAHNDTVLHINELYCSKVDPIYNIHLDILAIPNAYMWMQ